MCLNLSMCTHIVRRVVTENYKQKTWRAKVNFFFNFSTCFSTFFKQIETLKANRKEYRKNTTRGDQMS